MEIKMKKGELLSLYQSISTVMGLMDDKKWQEKYKINAAYSYALAKNQKLLETDVQILQKFIQIEPDPQFDEFEKKRTDLLIKLSNKDQDGNPITQVVNGQVNYSIPTNKLEEWNAEYAKLDEQYKEVIEKRNERIKEIQEFLDSEEQITVTIYQIDPKNEQEGIPPLLNRNLLVLYNDYKEEKRVTH